MSRLFAALLLVEVFFVALMPPGLCSCWLNPAVAKVHVHIGFPEPHHSHDYLSWMADGTVKDASLQIGGGTELLVILALGGGILFLMRDNYLHGTSWISDPTHPPPKNT